MAVSGVSLLFLPVSYTPASSASSSHALLLTLFFFLSAGASQELANRQVQLGEAAEEARGDCCSHRCPSLFPSPSPQTCLSVSGFIAVFDMSVLWLRDLAIQTKWQASQSWLACSIPCKAPSQNPNLCLLCAYACLSTWRATHQLSGLVCSWDGQQPTSAFKPFNCQAIYKMTFL